MGYRLAYLYVCARQYGEAMAHIIEYLLMTTTVELEWCFYLTYVHTESMLVKFCTSCFPRHGLNLRHLQQQPFRPRSYGIALLQGNAG